MPRNDRREETRQRTLKTADHHRQYWTAEEDDVVLARTVWYSNPQQMSDELLAIHLGRTQLAVSQRRIVLNKLMSEGMTLEEIHDVERFKRTRSNEGRYGLAIANLRRTCEECFCDPHVAGCSKAD